MLQHCSKIIRCAGLIAYLKLQSLCMNVHRTWILSIFLRRQLLFLCDFSCRDVWKAVLTLGLWYSVTCMIYEYVKANHPPSLLFSVILLLHVYVPPFLYNIFCNVLLSFDYRLNTALFDSHSHLCIMSFIRCHLYCHIFWLIKSPLGKYTLTIIYKLLNCVCIWIHMLQHSVTRISHIPIGIDFSWSLISKDNNI
jgi:hypothetical protein